jgi:putative serine protease PepD
VTFYAVDGRTELGSLEDRWSFGTDDTCITVPFTLAKKLPGVIAELTIGSVVTDNPLVFQ